MTTNTRPFSVSPAMMADVRMGETHPQLASRRGRAIALASCWRRRQRLEHMARGSRHPSPDTRWTFRPRRSGARSRIGPATPAQPGSCAGAEARRRAAGEWCSRRHRLEPWLWRRPVSNQPSTVLRAEARVIGIGRAALRTAFHQVHLIATTGLRAIERCVSPGEQILYRLHLRARKSGDADTDRQMHRATSRTDVERSARYALAQPLGEDAAAFGRCLG